ncbi:DUF1801 domain-containing protein [Allomuricauda sp. d1]|uniref:DUF1801 domain-containing protein n=1 Tax=Allomuricauda sp. d1 TaxID=3136725 RepID=UPI0031E40071
MNKFQKVKFDSVEEFLGYLPQEELDIVTRLRGLIAETFPQYREKLAYNVPFYYNHRRICFIWPSAIPWGNLDHGVALGFVNASKIDPEQHFLKYDNRKTMGRMIINNLSEIDDEKMATLKFLLQEAYLVDGG